MEVLAMIILDLTPEATAATAEISN